MRKLLFYIVAIIAVGLLPAWISYGSFMLVGDLLYQHVPFIVETKRMISSGIPFWSWNTFFGDNFLASYSYYTITNPFAWINCLFPEEYIPQSITLTFFLKFICLGLVTYKFFRKVQITTRNAQIGSLLFCFSSFNLINIGYYHFVEPVICFVLLLIAIEKYLNFEKNAIIFLFLSSFLIIFIDFYFAPCTFIPASIYFIFRLQESPINDKTRTFFYAIPIVILGLLLSSFIIVPTVLHMIGGTRTELSILRGYNPEDRINALFLPKLSEGSIPLVEGTLWTSTAAYIPVIGILLAFLFCKKNRNNSITYTLLLLLLLYLTPLNGIFSFFTDPDYTRWLYALVFFAVFASVRHLDSGQGITNRESLIYIGICIILLLVRYSVPIYQKIISHTPFYEDEIPFTILVGAIFLVSSIFLFIYCKRPRLLLQLVILFSALHLMITVFIRNDKYIEKFEKDQTKIGIFNTYIKDNLLAYNSQNNNYRTDFLTRFDPNVYANLGELKNIPSVNTYHSITNKKITNLCHTTEKQALVPFRGILKDCNRTSFDCLMSVKQIIQFKDTRALTPMEVPATILEENDSFKRYQAQFYIPFGFTYNHYVIQECLDTLNEVLPKIDIPAIMLSALSIQKNDTPELSKYLEPQEIIIPLSLDSIVDARKQTTAENVEWTTHGFSCQIDMNRDNVVFFSVPSDPGFTATVDGKETKIYEVNFGLSGIIVPKGKHFICFEFVPSGLWMGTIISIVSLLLFFILYIFLPLKKDTL